MATIDLVEWGKIIIIGNGFDGVLEVNANC